MTFWQITSHHYKNQSSQRSKFLQVSKFVVGNFKMDKSILKHRIFTFILTFIMAYSVILILTIGFRIFNTDAGITAPSRRIRTNWSRVHLDRIAMDCEIKVALILCGDENGVKNPAVDFDRQFNQSMVLIKSILITLGDSSKSSGSENCVKVVLISNNRSHFERAKDELLGNTEIWDVAFTRRLKLAFVAVKYPPGTSWMRKLFRPCATLRLFLPDLLHYDSVLYLDTDIIFLESIEKLWAGLKAYNDSTLASMAPCLFHYGTPRNSIPFYGSSGLNAGIMLMNLTRMRNTQWTHKIQTLGTQYRSQIKLADQDILNIYFHKFPQELHLLSCDWNFRPFQCREGNYCEDETIKSGISAIHGNALSFTKGGPEPLFYAIYKTLRDIKLNSSFDLKDLVKKLEIELQFIQERVQSPCAKYSGFDVLVMSRLDSLLAEQNEIRSIN